MPAKDILRKLGPLKNQLLIFTIIASLVTTAFAIPLSAATTPPWKPVCGVAMHFMTILMFTAAGVFYAYAFFRLPSSAQELEFSEVVQKQLREHQDRIRAPRGKRGE